MEHPTGPADPNPAAPRARRRRRGQGEDGAIMVIALVAVTVFGLIAAAVGGFASSAMADTVVTRTKTALVESAAGGARVALARAEIDASFCTSPSAPSTITQQLNGVDVAVSCTGDAGAVRGIGGFALVSTGTDNSANVLTATPGYRIEGAVLLRGNSQADVTVTGGDLYVDKPGGSCSTTFAVETPNVAYIRGNGQGCTTPPGGWPAPVSSPALPTTPATVPADGDTTPPVLQVITATGTCHVFRPGRYTEPPLLSPTGNYFASGTYYFEGIGDLDVSTGPIVVGAPGSDEAAVTGQVPCITDDQVPGSEGGTGAVFVLGGDSRLVNGGQAGMAFEMFARRCATACTLDGVSVLTVPQGTAGYVASTATQPNKPPFDGGAIGNLVVHGQIWVWDGTARIGVTATDPTRSQAYGAVAAGRLDLLGTGARLELENGDVTRAIRITSTATHPRGGADQRVEVEALVRSGVGRGAAITTWVTSTVAAG